MDKQRARRADLREHLRRNREIDPELRAKLLKVTPTLFGRFLVEKGVRKGCLACGSAALFVPEAMTNDPDNPITTEDIAAPDFLKNGFNERLLHYVSFEVIHENRPDSIQNLQYRVTCQNCGFMSTYRIKPVIDWVEKELNAKDKDAEE
ncbi:TPA: hypothetical protein ACXIGW_000111 [Serratia marcescens]